jgi:hypothetical protein
MNCSDLSSARLAQLHPFERPHYFHGQLLEVRHFESEQEYFRGKLWLINRLLHGYGVVCGLDVQAAAAGGPNVVVTSGLALDPWGREIVVASDSKPVAIPPRESPAHGKDRKPSPDLPNQRQDHCDDDDEWVHLVICYRECATGPEPVMSAGCNGDTSCTYGTTRETYTIPQPRPGKAPKLDFTPQFRDPFRARPFDYCELAEWVTRNCVPCIDQSEDPCLPLANIRRPAPEDSIKDIDICVRPIVYGLDLLFEMMLASGIDPQNRRGAKP